jgi:uncharacterized membrane protein
MVFFYLSAGIVHFLNPSFFLAIMPFWLPAKIALIYISGIAEIILALLLLPVQTRKASAQLIMLMLVVYLLVIHVPQSIDFYKTKNPYLFLSLVRIPLQFLLLAWAQRYTKSKRSKE